MQNSRQAEAWREHGNPSNDRDSCSSSFQQESSVYVDIRGTPSPHVDFQLDSTAHTFDSQVTHAHSNPDATRYHPLLQSSEHGMVAKSTKAEIKTPFGLKCKSPKATEKKAAKRENRASMCDFGPEASPKAGLVGVGSDIPSEHEIHAQNAENAGTHITGVLVREKPCSSYIGGGAGTRTRVRKSVNEGVYERSMHFYSRASDSCKRDSSAPVRRGSSTVDGPNMSSKPALVTPVSVHAG